MLVEKIDIQGHRGCRGIMPENTIPGFIRALESGVTTLEMDVVIASDESVIVSHDPYFHHHIATAPDGQEVTEDNMLSHNIFEMNYATIADYDVGLKPHVNFELQRKIPAIKPKLSMVIESVESYIRDHKIPPVQYSIELKRKLEYDNQFHPSGEIFVDHVLQLLKQYKNLEGRIILQCFDIETLRIIRQKQPQIRLAYLIENSKNFKYNIDKLGFIPNIYSPSHNLVDAELVSFCHEKQMQLIPWTVNEVSDLERLMLLGVDGIISDYPDRAIEIFEGLQLSK